MKTSFFALLALGAAGALTTARADLAPDHFGNAVFNASLTASTAGANGSGTFSDIFTGTGIDYSLSTSGAALSDAVNYSYSKTSPTTATISEPSSANTASPLATVLTFTSPTEGTFVITYSSSGATQSGSFVLTSVPFTTPAADATVPLVNMSTRLTITAGGFAISGFVVGGDVPRTILVRAVGPTLKHFPGVPSPLVDPKFDLYSGQHVIGSNDNWSDDATRAATIKSVSLTRGAYPLDDGSKDAAFLITLAPGSYTAIVRSSSSTDAGDVLLETYFIE